MKGPVEAADSSAVCMRSVAAALRGRFLDPFEIPLYQRLALSAVALLGPDPVRRVVEMGVRWRGIAPSWADRITAEGLARRAVALYDGLEGPFDAVVIGAPNGGVAHIAAALRAPFLSQHFLLSFRDPTDPDDVQTTFEHGSALAERILQREPTLVVVNHYDPLHDRYLVRWVNHIRLKLLDLPEAYKAFIRQRLRPGGTVIFIDCRYRWLQYRVGPRHTFQVGGLGDVTPREYLEGRPEIERLRGRRGGWSLEDLSLEERPESEWGAEPPPHPSQEAAVAAGRPAGAVHPPAQFRPYLRHSPPGGVPGGAGGVRPAGAGGPVPAVSLRPGGAVAAGPGTGPLVPGPPRPRAGAAQGG